MSSQQTADREGDSRLAGRQPLGAPSVLQRRPEGAAALLDLGQSQPRRRHPRRGLGSRPQPLLRTLEIAAR